MGGFRSVSAVLGSAVLISELAIVGTATATAVATPSFTPKLCSPPVTGAAFSFKNSYGDQHSGNRYGVSAFGVSCSLARTWVPKLTHAIPAGALDKSGAYGLLNTSGHAFVGPAGFKCVGTGPPLSQHRAPPISGWCWSPSSKPYNSGTTPYFEWSIQE